MGLVALADFGSTYTKVSLLDRGEGLMLARAEAPTETAGEAMDGYRAALELALAELGGRREAPETTIAASSAGGGLRVAAVGLVSDLTAAAARQVALNSGARVVAVLAGQIGEEGLAELSAARPEIVLFAGGTDGGQRDLVLANARRLAESELGVHAVVACNATVAEGVAEILIAGGFRAEVAGNVMPELGRIEIAPAREAISRAFLDHVIGGKGLSADPGFERMVRMPTPEAVLRATELLAVGTGTETGVGDLVVVDVGGATTDVHSHRAMEPSSPGIEGPLLRSPLTLRTVEGDLGVRSGAVGALAADRRWIEAEMGAVEGLGDAAAERARRPAWIPDDEDGARVDGLFARACATQALARHCGTMLLSPGGAGPPTLVRSGPDLSEVATMVGTGGVFAHREDGMEILETALERRAQRSLAPRDPELRIDDGYLLAAAGLLSTLDPEVALRLIKSGLDLS